MILSMNNIFFLPFSLSPVVVACGSDHVDAKIIFFSRYPLAAFDGHLVKMSSGWCCKITAAA